MTPDQILLLDKALTLVILSIKKLQQLANKSDEEILAMIKEEELRSNILLEQLK